MTRPWTFEQFVSETTEVVDIHDPNLGQLVATFYDAEEAEAYLKWRNKKQAKKQAKRWPYSDVGS